jgi:hypothetical protein
VTQRSDQCSLKGHFPRVDDARKGGEEGEQPGKCTIVCIWPLVILSLAGVGAEFMYVRCVTEACMERYEVSFCCSAVLSSVGDRMK